MQRLKHNKKRNTAFLYESLVRELTKSILEKEEERREIVLSIIKEAFKSTSILHSELECYRSLIGEEPLNTRAAEKLLFMTKRNQEALDKKKLFNEQTELINRVNRELGKEVFSNFVPNYKDLATLFQIFNKNVTSRSRVLLEESILFDLARPPQQNTRKAPLQPINNLVYHTFVDKFNGKYSSLLTEEQQSLLNHYILSFVDNGTELKLYLNEEIGRLKHGVQTSLKSQELTGDKRMVNKASEVLSLLETFSAQVVDTGMIKKILKIQSLVTELES
jgi:hypothetical protein|tara:strand:- start:3124 stop:3954 length:831 start_codon:yes stop_codon:yes gene_type:complete